MRPMTVSLSSDPTPDLSRATASIYAAAVMARLRRLDLPPDRARQLLSRITASLRATAPDTC